MRQASERNRPSVMHTAKGEPHTRKGSRDRRGEQGTQGILGQSSPGGFRGGRGHRRAGKAGALCLGVRPALRGRRGRSQSVVCGNCSYCGQGRPQSFRVVKGQEFCWSTGSFSTEQSLPGDCGWNDHLKPTQVRAGFRVEAPHYLSLRMWTFRAQNIL